MKTRSKTPKPVVEVKKSIEKPKKVVQKRGKQLKQNIVEEEEVVETKIIKKPKTVKHSQYQASRIQRGKTQRMFLLSVKRELATWDANIVIWRCEVQGHSGNRYQVVISNSLSCSCPDYYRQRKPCKHIYFMISQVAQFDQFFDKMKNVLTLTKPKLNQLDEALNKRLSSRIKPKQPKVQSDSQQKQEVDLGDETDCAICFEQLQKTADLFQCNQCKKHFHDGCITAWRSRNTTCPLCRNDLINAFSKKREADQSQLIDVADLDKNDPLKQLKKIAL